MVYAGNSLITILVLFALNTRAQVSFSKLYPSIEWTEGIDVIKTHDGGYLIAGDTILFGSEQDVFLIKTDSLGVLEWTSTYGIADKQEKTVGVISTSDNAFIITGRVKYTEFTYYPFVYKIDSVGEIIWSRDTISGFGTSAYEAIETPDKGFLLTGGGGMV